MKWMNEMTVETMELEWSAIKGMQRKKKDTKDQANH